MKTKVYELKADRIEQAHRVFEEAQDRREHAEANAPKPQVDPEPVDPDADDLNDALWDPEDDIPQDNSEAVLEEANDSWLVAKREHLAVIKKSTMGTVRNDLQGNHRLGVDIERSPIAIGVQSDTPVCVVHKRCGGFDVHLHGSRRVVGDWILTLRPKKSPTRQGQGDNHGRENKE